MSWRPPWIRTESDRSELEESRQQLAKARADEVRISRITEDHRREQARNHFGERLQRALGGNS